MIEHVRASRYVTPLREGGSLPGIVEADDLGTYVLKFRGAGQGLKVLVAEVLVAELARRIGLRVPELKAVSLDPVIAKYEADEEVQDLLTASVGLNLGVDFLPGAFGFDNLCEPDPEEAATIVWLDAFVANVDRSWRNPNLLMWHGDLWCIDHGAALYFHHSWPANIADPSRFARQPYDASDHVLGRWKRHVAAIDDQLAGRARDAVETAAAQVPDEWLETSEEAPTPDDVRAAYVAFLHARLDGGRPWLPVGAAA